MKTFTILAASVLMAGTAAPAVVVAGEATFQTPTAPQRGAVVRAADGAELGRLEGRRTNEAGVAELVIRDADGQMRAIPASAVMVHGDELHAAWSAARFREAPPLIPAAAVGAAATGAGGNQGPPPERAAPASPGVDPSQPDRANPTRPLPAEQQQAPDPRRS